MKEEINKQTVKNYLSGEGADLSKTLKENIQVEENWYDFEKELTSLLQKFCNEPNFINKEKINSLLAKNYMSSISLAKETVDKMIRGIGIRESSDIDKSSKESKREEVYTKVGISYDHSGARMAQEKIDKRNGTTTRRGTLSKQELANAIEKELKGRNISEKERESEKPVKDKKTLKTKEKGFKLTSSILSLQKQVSTKILAENKEAINESSQKVQSLIAELESARTEIVKNNKNITIPENVKELYDEMENSEIDEDFLVDFEQNKNQIVSSMREVTDNLFLTDELDNEILNFSLARFDGLEEDEVKEEIRYAILDSKFDQDGNLILPPRSIFKEEFLKPNGEVKDGKNYIIDLISNRCKIRNMSRLDNSDFVEIAKQARDLEDGKELEEYSSLYNLKEYLKNNPNLASDKSDEIFSQLASMYTEYEPYQSVQEEAEINHKLLISEEIREQLATLQNIIKQYDEKEAQEGELSKSDSKKRELALKIAKRKVSALEKTGINEVIQSGEKQAHDVLEQASEILIPNLQNVRDKDFDKFEKNFGEKDEDREQ